MKRYTMTMMGIFAATMLGGATASAGARWGTQVTIDMGSRTAQGTMADVRASGDAFQSIGYVVRTSTTDPAGVTCYATSSSNVAVQCATTQASFVQAAGAMTSNSNIVFKWSPSGACTYLSLENVSTNFRLVQQEANMSLIDEPTVARIRFSCEVAEPVWLRHQVECLFARMVNRGEFSAGQRVPALEVSFRHPAPADTGPHERAFGLLPRFSRLHDEIVVPRAVVDLSQRSSAPALIPIMERHLAARQAAKQNGVAIDGYDHVGVTLPSNDDSGFDCACGLAYVGRSPAQPNPGIQHTSLFTCTDPNAFAHEMGHGFGLNHASKAHCMGAAMKRDIYSACDIEEYGNQFNVMGNGLGHMNAFQKTTMKWLTGCNDVRVTRDGVFDLVAIQAASDAVQSLQIPTGDVKDGNPLYYYVEYRNPALATFNAGGTKPRELAPGLHIDVAQDFAADTGDSRPLILDLSTGTPNDYVDPRLTPGRSFTDPDGRVTVEMVSGSGDKASVKVTFPGGGKGTNRCGDGSLLPGVEDNSAITLFQDCDYAGWAVTLEPGDYTMAQLVAAGALDNDASSMQIKPGYQAVLFDGPDLTGESHTVTGKLACLVDLAFNDKVSSLRIELIPGPDAGAGGSPPDAGGPVDEPDAGVTMDAGDGADAGGTDPGEPA